MALLEVKELTKSFEPGKTAVSGVSLAIEKGEIICLLGPSGCGKTTLLRLIAGLEQPDSGQVFFEGRDIGRVPPHQRDFGMMFQDFALFPHKNVAANVAFGLEMHHEAPEPSKARVAQILELVDLSGYDQRDVAQLSGGEQQRVALARALAPRPSLLMLDEPLGALDRALRERLMLELRAILKQVGVTAVYVTHDQTEAFAIADRIAVMNAGRIEQFDEPEKVFARPGTLFVARFLGFHNLLPGTAVSNSTLKTAIGVFQLPNPLLAAGQTVTLLIKPNDVQLVNPTPTSPGVNEFNAQITAVSFRGKYYQVWCQSGGQALLFELPTMAPWKVSDQVRISITPDALHCCFS